MRIRLLPFLLALLGLSLTSYGQTLKIISLACEYQVNPVGIDIDHPRLSWKMISPQRNVMQASYEIRCGADPATLAKGKNLSWTSGKVSTDRSTQVEGPAVKSRERTYWQVRATDNNGVTSPWSEIGFWETGLLQASDWTAKWIQPESTDDSVGGPAHLFRKKFDLRKTIKSARVYITAHGIYEAFLNGNRIGKDYLTPGWTSYNKRLQYQVYDVTTMLVNGTNAIGVGIGDGWFRGYLAWQDNKNIYGKQSALLMQLEVTYTDNTTAIITTDDTWKSSSNGPVRESGIYSGELYDARKEMTGWSSATFNDAAWHGVKVADIPKQQLVATNGPAVRKHETFRPVKIFKTPAGEQVIDFGQNLVGWVRISVTGKPGDRVTISHAEVLDKKGNFYTENLRAAKQRLVYVLSGKGTEIYEPHFTFQGFRYIRVEGIAGELKAADFTAIAVYSDMETTGKFSSSHALLNQLQHNIAWGQKGNFVDVPTDCPQRDERLGWTGDAQVFSRTAVFNMNAAGFFTKWLKDVAADQTADGRIPFVVPNVLGENASASTGWADAATIIPWNLYVAYDDKRVLETQYPSMKRWVDFMRDKSSDGLWNTGFHFGDWLFYRPFDDNDGRSAVTDKYLIAQAFFYHSTQLLVNAAMVLGKTEDVTAYKALAEVVRTAFMKEYVTPSGRLISGTQTAYVVALNFNLLPETMRAGAAEKLVQNIRDYGNHLTTGFLGTPYLCHVLTRFGYSDTAYDLLLQETYPSWLYPVKMGATTIWERWDGIKPDSTFQTPGMNSFNHYAYGAIGDWMYSVVAGINSVEQAPGYKKIVLTPTPGGTLTHASAELETLYGTVRSGWKTENGLLKVDVAIPVNCTAVLTLPNAASQKVTEQNIDVATVPLFRQQDKGKHLELTLGSGNYHFEYPFTQEKKK